MQLSRRFLAAVGLTGVAVVVGVAAGGGAANASTPPVHHTMKKPHVIHHVPKHHPQIHAASADTFDTKRAGVEVRSMADAGRGSRIVARLGHAGTQVTVSCYTLGEAVDHDRVWYRTTDPAAGFVAGTDLRSGHDPATGVNRC